MEMELDIATTADAAKITGIAFVSVYVDDFESARHFYTDVLGLEKQYEMTADSCFFRLGEELGLYLEGKNHGYDIRRDSIRSSFTLAVPSAQAMYRKLKSAGVRMVHDAPMDMGQGDFWFQFYDPAGNILEVLGGK
jgi:catechol 2,3-dioxygenase-like lactoylglutathione lyase family enzyme